MIVCSDKRALTAILAVFAVAILAGASYAADEEASISDVAHGSEHANNEGIPMAIRAVGLGLAAALTITLAGLATAKVQAAVGAGGTGAMAEKPELFTSILILFAIPETIVILGFVVAVLILGHV